MQIPG